MRSRKAKRVGLDHSRGLSEVHYHQPPDKELHLPQEENRPIKSSIKDVGLILSLSTVISISLVTMVFGLDKIVDQVRRNETTELLLATLVFICLFSLVSLLIVKMAVHYLVYLAVATFCGIIFPVSPKKQQKTLNQIYANAKK